MVVILVESFSLDFEDKLWLIKFIEFHKIYANLIPVLTVQASDADTDANARLSYKLKMDDKSDCPFEIDRSLGMITTTEELDREKKSEYDLVVIATDAGRPPMESQATVKVVVSDVNDNQPIFSKAKYIAKVPEDTSIGTVSFTKVGLA